MFKRLPSTIDGDLTLTKNRRGFTLKKKKKIYVIRLFNFGLIIPVLALEIYTFDKPLELYTNSLLTLKCGSLIKSQSNILL